MGDRRTATEKRSPINGLLQRRDTQLAFLGHRLVTYPVSAPPLSSNTRSVRAARRTSWVTSTKLVPIS